MPGNTAKERALCIACDPNAPVTDGKQLIKHWKAQIPHFPDITPKQAQVVELIADYVRKGQKIRLSRIARKLRSDYRNVVRWVSSDVKVSKAIDYVMTQYGLSAMAVAIGKVSHDLINDTTVDMAKFDALGKVTGRIQPNQVNIQTNIVLTSYIDKESGEVRWSTSEKDAD